MATTACARVEIKYKGDNRTKLFTFPFTYTNASDVNVALWDDTTKEYVDVARDKWKFANATTVEFTDIPQVPTDPNIFNVRIYRITDLTQMEAEFYPGSSIRAQDLNDNFDQLRLAIEEGRCQVPEAVFKLLSDQYWNKTTDTVTRLQQLGVSGTSFVDDKHILTAAALSERFDVIVSDTKPPNPPITETRQPGKIWIDDGTFQIHYWEPAARAWVSLANVGPVGPAAGFGTPTATGLPAGSAPTVTATGPDTAKVFAFGLPKGDQGIQGITGATGAAAGFGTPTVTGLAAGAAPTITATGPDTAKVFAFGIPKGDKGDKGDAGANYTLPVATAAVLGGVKTGTNIAIAADGTISANLPGALIYKGTADVTAAAPATKAKGDVYIATTAGTVSATWTGITGTIAAGDMVLWDGAKWDRVGAAGFGVTTVTGTAPVVVGGTAAAPAISVSAATTAAAGITRLADAAAITAGTAGRVVDAAQLKAVSDADDWTRTGTTIAPRVAGDAVDIDFPLGTAALPGLTPVGDPNTGIYSPGADQLAISTGGVQRLLATDTGLIGIGSPAATAASRLAVNDAVPVANDALPTMQVYRRGISTGGSGVTEIGLDVNVASTHNANSATGIRVSAKSALEANAVYAIDASVITKNNGIARAARFTGGHGNTAGIGTQNVVDVIATVNNTGVFGGVHGLYVEMPDYDGTVNTALLLNNKNVGTAKQNTIKIDRNAVNIGNIYTTNTDFGIYGKNNLKLDVGASTRAQIDSTGKLLVGPNLAANTAGGILQLSGGITFPATAVASTDPNTLDDYEEGTWTPAYLPAGNIWSYTKQVGTYVKVGTIVTLFFEITAQLDTVGNLNGQVIIVAHFASGGSVNGSGICTFGTFPAKKMFNTSASNFSWKAGSGGANDGNGYANTTNWPAGTSVAHIGHIVIKTAS